MSEIMSGDSLICISSRDTMREISELAFLGRKNPAYAIEQLQIIIPYIELQIILLEKIKKEIFNDKT